MKFNHGDRVKKFKGGDEVVGTVISYEGNGEYLVQWDNELHPWLVSTYSLDLIEDEKETNP